MIHRVREWAALLRAAARVGPGHVTRIVRTLDRMGYWQTVRDRQWVDIHGRSIPWYAYPLIEFIEDLDFSNHRVFEYGAGNSSLYWRHIAKQVVSVEHDRAWYEKIRDNVADNQTILLETEPRKYVETPLANNPPFDVVVIDGVYRRDCVEPALASVADEGLIIVDNSDWLPATTAALRDAGMTQVDFKGLCPGIYYPIASSVFFRSLSAFPRKRNTLSVASAPERVHEFDSSVLHPSSGRAHRGESPTPPESS